MANDRAATFFIIQSLSEKGMRFYGDFADGSPIVIEGYAGWQIVPRPKNISIVEWQGRNPIAVEIPFILDYWMLDDLEKHPNPGERCETMIAKLEHLAGVGTGSTQPAVCTVHSGGVIPHDFKNRPTWRWVIEQLTWDRSVELRNQVTGRRMRAGGTITIRQFVTARDILRKIGPNQKARKPERYQVRKGDTLVKIANKKYKDPSKWKLIGDANGIRHRRQLTVGKWLKIPRI